MKKNRLLLLVVFVVFIVTSCKTKSEKYTYYLDWPLDLNTGYILQEQGNCVNSVYGNSFVNDELFIGGQEGQAVYAPIDCVVKYVSDIGIHFPDGISSMSWKNKKAFLEDDDKPNYSFMTIDNVCSTVGFITEDGRELWIKGLVDYSLKPGDQISKGQRIGYMGFIRTFFETPCISFAGSLKTDAFVFNNFPDKVFTIDLDFEEYNPKKKLSQTQLLEDFDLFYTYIYEDHPALIDSKVRDYFGRISTSIKNEIKGKESIADFKKQLLRCTATLNCSHTKLTSENARQSEMVFPLILEYKNGNCFLIADCRKKNKLEKGIQILSINGKEIGQIYEEMTDCLGFDSTTPEVREELNRYILSEYYSYYGRSVFDTVTYLDLNGKKKTAILFPITRMDMENVSLPEEQSAVPRYSDLFTIVNDKEACITIQRIDQLANKEKVNYIFEQIKNLGIEKVTIDLRDNPGGDIDNAAYFFSFFADYSYKMYEYLEIRHFEPFISIENSLNLFNSDRDLLFHESIPFIMTDSSSVRFPNTEQYEPEIQLHYDGDVTVLINAFTSSAAVRLAQLLYENGARLIGTETSGGAYFSNGLKFAQVMLPNSKIILEMPLYRVCYKEEIPEPQGLRP